MKLLKLSSTLLAIFLAATACKENGSSKSTSNSTVTNKELKIGVTQEFENLNPIISQMNATTYLYSMVGRPLTVMDTNSKWVPKLAERVPTFENGLAKFIEHNGKKTIEATWRIKDSMNWGDGKPVTGHDFKFSWSVAIHPNITVGEKEEYTQVVEINIDPKDPKKFTTIYDKPRWDFAHLASFYIVPKHLEEAAFKKYSSEPLGYEKNSLYVTDPTNPGLYAGPYRVSEIKLGSHATLIPNEKWTETPVKIKKIIAKLIPNTATLEANVRSNTIDMISILGFKFDQALKFEKTINKEQLPLTVNFKPGTVYEHIDLQLKNPILQDIKVRKALVYGANRDDLVKALFEGKQEKAIHNLAPIDPWYTDNPKDIVLYPYSPRKAKKLLDEAGWKVGKNGIREKDGKKLSFQFMTTSGDKTRELVETYLQDQWKKIGIEITIKNEPARVYFGETVRKSKFPALAMFAWVSSPENSPKSTLHSSNIPTKSNSYSGQNSPGWKNADVDKLLTKLDESFKHEERVNIMKKVLYHYTNEVPVIPLYYRSNISVTPSNMTGYKPSPHQFPSSYHVENWSLN